MKVPIEVIKKFQVVLLLIFAGLTDNMRYIFLIAVTLVNCSVSLLIHENVVFHKTNEIYTNRARWLVTFIHDLRPYEVFIDKISHDLGKTDEIMAFFTDYYERTNLTGYVHTFNSLHEEIGILNDTYEIVRDTFVDYRSLRSQRRINKRSLLPIVGQAMSFLFGTVSDADLTHIQNSVNDLAKNQGRIIHNLEHSITILNLSRVQISENRRAIIDLVISVQKLDGEIRGVKEMFQKRFIKLEQFITNYLQFKLILDEIKQATQNAILYLDNLRTELNMLSLNHLSPSTITPKNLRTLLIDLKNKIPPHLMLAANPTSDIWHFYNTLTCTTYLEESKILVVLSIPLLDRKERYEIYKVHNLPVPLHNTTLTNQNAPDMVARYELESDALMINVDRTKYALLTSDEYLTCSSNHVTACDPKNAIYQSNLSKACVIAIFLRHTDNIKMHCRSTVILDTRLPIAKYIHSGMWVIATRRTMTFTVVCPGPIEKRSDVTIFAPLGVVQLDMTCRASNNYLSLPSYYERKVKGHIMDAMGSLLTLRNISSFSLWRNFTSNFPNLTSVEIPSDIVSLKEIPMPTFIDYMHDYDRVRLSEPSTSIWTYMSVIMGTFILIFMVAFFCCKCTRIRIVKYCQDRFARCCGERKSVVEPPIEVKGSWSSEEDEAAGRMLGGQLPSTHDPKVTIAALKK